MTYMTNSAPTAKISHVATQYDITPPYVTVDFDGNPVEIDTLTVRAWNENTTIDTAGYRLTKSGTRKGSHVHILLPFAAEGPFLAAVGVAAERPAKLDRHETIAAELAAKRAAR